METEEKSASEEQNPEIENRDFRGDLLDFYDEVHMLTSSIASLGNLIKCIGDETKDPGQFIYGLPGVGLSLEMIAGAILLKLDTLWNASVEARSVLAAPLLGKRPSKEGLRDWLAIEIGREETFLDSLKQYLQVTARQSKAHGDSDFYSLLSQMKRALELLRGLQERLAS